MCTSLPVKKRAALVARGLNNAEIASQLSLSERTVRNHVSIILSELNVTDRTQAAVIVIQHGLVVADSH